MKYFRKLVAIIILSLTGTYHLGGGATIVFRYDDIQLITNEMQEQIVECFADNNIPLSIAVIPFNGNGDVVYDMETVARIRELCKKGQLEVCLHGFNHHSFEHDLGEMCGYSDDEQYLKLSRGKHFLDSLLNINVSTFIPPFNAYNEGTLEALEKLGFTAISSGLYPGQKTSSTVLQYYPESLCDLKDVIGTMKQAVEVNHKRNGIIVIMLHAYDITEQFTIADLDEFLRHVSGLPEVKFATFSELADGDDISNAKRITANMETNLLTKVLETKYIIQPTWKAVGLKVLNYLAYLFIMTVLFIPAFAFRRKVPFKYCVEFWVAAALALGIIVWLHLLGPLKAMAVAVLLPVLGAISLIIINKRHGAR